jgi:hypothetical protein
MIPQDEKDPAAGVEDELPDGTPADTDPYSELEADVLKWKVRSERTGPDQPEYHDGQACSCRS